MDIVARVKALLTTPNTEWPVIEAEASSVESIYRNYLVYLAAIPAIVTFINKSLIGIYVPIKGIERSGVFTGLVSAVIYYVMTLALIYAVALVIDALAPNFGGKKNTLNAFKLSGYSTTAGFIASIFTVVPLIGWIIALAVNIYGIYIFYIGLPVLMKNPPEKSLLYTVAICVVYVVVFLVIGLVIGLLAGV